MLRLPHERHDDTTIHRCLLANDLFQREITAPLRYYKASQVALGQAIPRFRDLETPLEQLKGVLHAPDASARNKLIIAHLEHMKSALQQTQQTVAWLRALLKQPHALIAVEYRSVAAATAIAISEPVHRHDIAARWSEAFEELHQVLASSSAVRAGPDGALYPNEFFEEEPGEVVAFIPVAEMLTPAGRPQLIEIPGAELAIIVHNGAISEPDQTYGALGTFVAEREIGVQGPIREHYVVSSNEATAERVHPTEVCWPVFHTKGPDWPRRALTREELWQLVYEADPNSAGHASGRGARQTSR